MDCCWRPSWACCWPLRVGRFGGWGAWLTAGGARFQRLSQGRQLALTGSVALLVALTGWLTWGDGLYRRLGDVGQLAVTTAAAAIYYAAPSFLVYAPALLLLFVLLLYRPLWGLALIVFSAPFYVLPKPLLDYQFSAVEIFTLLTVVAALVRRLRAQALSGHWSRPRFRAADMAVLAFVAVAAASLLFTARLDVATNELRVVIVEPALFYLALRLVSPRLEEQWWLVHAFVGGAVLVAVVGLGEYLSGSDLITAEGGLFRLRSVYGSPNNVALYLDRVLPLVAAVLLLDGGTRRRWYGAAAVPLVGAFLLTFSKGGLLLGLPAGLLVVCLLYLRSRRRRVWPWLAGVAAAGVVGLFIALQIPALAARLDPRGATSFVRLNLWRASLQMIADHPLFGVGLDNFLYAHRGRYILQEAWREPDLNHPHNIVLDFATRLGLLGAAAGTWLFALWGRGAWRRWRHEGGALAAGALGALAATVAHGLVDHSFFLVDLAFAFFLLYGLSTTSAGVRGAAFRERWEREPAGGLSERFATTRSELGPVS